QYQLQQPGFVSGNGLRLGLSQDRVSWRSPRRRFSGSHLLKLRHHRIGSDSQAQSSPLSVLVNEHHILSLLNGFGHLAQNRQTTFVGQDIIRGAETGKVVIKKTVGSLDQLLKSSAAEFFDETVRVMW